VASMLPFTFMNGRMALNTTRILVFILGLILDISSIFLGKSRSFKTMTILYRTVCYMSSIIDTFTVKRGIIHAILVIYYEKFSSRSSGIYACFLQSKY
jgi:hypothetical protein